MCSFVAFPKKWNRNTPSGTVELFGPNDVLHQTEPKKGLSLNIKLDRKNAQLCGETQQLSGMNHGLMWSQVKEAAGFGRVPGPAG